VALTDMARRFGRAPRGERLRAGVPHGHPKTTTFIAGLSSTGMIAPWVLDEPINGDAFTPYVTRVLVPELSPGNVVILNNLSSHKAPAVRAAIEAAGARLLFLLPPAFAGAGSTARTSTLSRWPSPSLRRICEKQPSGPSMTSGMPSAVSSTYIRPRNAQTIPQPLVTMQPEAAMYFPKPCGGDGQAVLFFRAAPSERACSG
jgi:hypothetical protein